MVGYAYPASGPVHAVSKKLLEVTPEALAEKRRKLMEEEAEAANALPEEEKRRQLSVLSAMKSLAGAASGKKDVGKAGKSGGQRGSDTSVSATPAGAGACSSAFRAALDGVTERRSRFR